MKHNYEIGELISVEMQMHITSTHEVAHHQDSGTSAFLAFRVLVNLLNILKPG